MPGGIFVLQAYGSGNQKLSGNPQTTFFSKLFNRYTHFAQEPITVNFNGSQELHLQNKITIKTTIKRNADLIRAPFLQLELPDIYAKLDSSGNGYEFRWVENLPNVIIDEAQIFIGGNKIDSFTGLYTYIHKQTTLDSDSQEIYDSFSGNIDDINNPSAGTLGDASGRYPWVVRDLSNTNAILNPSIRGRKIHIPLPFWFFQEPGQALPLIALQGHEVELFVTLNPILDLYQVREKGTSQWTRPSADDSTNIRYFLSSYDGDTTQETWKLNPRLMSHYIYLSDTERLEFATKEHEYLIKQRNHFETITPNSVLIDLKQHNLVSRILYTIRRTDFITNYNQHTNLLNWQDQNSEPTTDLSNAQFTDVHNSGIQSSDYKRDILQGSRILINGNEIFEEREPIYFNSIQPFLNTKIIETPGIYQYSFSLMPNEYQPSGVLNASRVRSLELELSLETPPSTTTLDAITGLYYSTYQYQYRVDVFTETYNFLKITSGLGGLMYAR